MRAAPISTSVVSALLATTAIASVFGTSSTAVAQQVALATDAPSSAGSSTAGESPAALQARIKELEAEIRTLRKKAATPKPAEPRLQNPAALTTPTNSTSPYVTPTSGAYPLAVKAPLAVRAFDWSGPYAGFSLGLGFLNANQTTTSTSTSVDSDLPSPPGLRTTDTTISTASGKARHETGALADLYVGYNFRTAPGWVSGVQLEGSLGRFFARFNESGVSNFTDVRSDVGLTNVQSQTFTFKDSLNITFMVSALARLGFLVTPRDLVYGLAGWSYAGFNTTLPSSVDPAFGANGVTVGAGWERQILDTWTLKLEYRYTQFESITVPGSSSSLQTNFNNIANPPVPVSSFSQTNNEASRISPSLHVIRVGLTHYFGDDWNAPAAAAGFYKAPPPPVYAWTGGYVGFSVGVGGMRTNASTVFSDSFTATQTVPPLGIFDESFTNGTVGSDSRFRPGGVADLFTGYNQQFGTWVAGVQLEGTVARFNERLARLSSSTENSFNVQFAGAPLSLNSTFSNSFLRNDTLTMNWMLSALGRVGFLVDPRDMVYALGGWSFANFSTSIESDDGNRTFTANGPSVGAGWERQIMDLWSFRAEYRYTHFLNRTLATQNTFSSTQANLFGGGASVTNSTNTSSTTISSDVHVFRFGLARALNL
jgi:opacity protein-like surface antigen